MAAHAQSYRLASGGHLDRTARVPFVFDGRCYTGYEGDTLASALLANGVKVVARSFKYHRPRGIYTAGAEEPNALVTVGIGARATPNTRATQVWLHGGLVAHSQNRWPSLHCDLQSAVAWLGPMLAAGFYYKTFMQPRRLWPLYERAIRHMAGMGRAPLSADPDRYDKQYHTCDDLIVGLGPAGLAAALAASGDPERRIIALDMDRMAGGSLLFDTTRIENMDGANWAQQCVQTLAARTNATVLLRTTAFGYYDDNLIAAVERCGASDPGGVRERVHWIRASRVILATGAHERPLIFPDNDRPGIMLTGAARAYLNRYAVAPGHRIAIFTDNDSAYALASDLQRGGIEIAALIDLRREPASTAAGMIGAPLHRGCGVSETYGKFGLYGIRVAPIGGGRTRTIECDALCISGGWTPAVQLHAQAQGALRFDEGIGAFVPAQPRQPHVSVGAAAGAFGTNQALQQGWAAGAARGPEPGPRRNSGQSAGAHTRPRMGPHMDPKMDSQAGRQIGSQAGESLTEARIGTGLAPVATEAPSYIACASPSQPELPPGRNRRKAFVDLQNDVTVADVVLAAREGYDSVEHLKRYTTLGMGTDQGKTSGINGFNLLAKLTHRTPGSLGATTFRPPYVPVTFGALAGQHRGWHLAATRRSALHGTHMQAGAVFVDAGLWLRPRCYPRGGESLQDAVNREVRTVRTSVGIVDVSTLGKIDIAGPDSLELLERVYCNRWRSLPIGKARYGLMLREDGIVMDDGTTSRLGSDHYFMTTSTAQASKVMSHLEYCLQVLWPELDVHVTSVTEQWCAIAIAGPRSRAVLAKVLREARLEGVAEGSRHESGDAARTGAGDGLAEALSDAHLPHLGVRQLRWMHERVRVMRLSFSGELAYEIYVPAELGPAVWARLLEEGRSEGIAPYGTDALTVLRVEKGHVAGPELDGRTTPADLGLGKLCSDQKFHIGRHLSARAALVDPVRPSLVGLLTLDPSRPLHSGAQLVLSEAIAADGRVANASAGASTGTLFDSPGHTPADTSIDVLGHTTTAVYSQTLGRHIALALLSGGLARKGSQLWALDPVRNARALVRVVDPVFFDSQGERMRG